MYITSTGSKGVSL